MSSHDDEAQPAAVPARGSVRPLGDRRPGEDHGEQCQLQEGEHGGAADVAELRRPPPHLDFDRPGPRRAEMRMTPNDVNENRKTIVAAAVIAGRMSGNEIA